MRHCIAAWKSDNSPQRAALTPASTRQPPPSVAHDMPPGAASLPRRSNPGSSPPRNARLGVPRAIGMLTDSIPAPSPTSGPPEPLAGQANPPLRIQMHDDGQATLVRDLKLHRLVLGAGGVKGAAYPGAIKALEETGQLARIREVGGSSIGAIVAAMLAAGMDAEGCKTLLDRINLPVLFSRKEKPATRLTQPPRMGRLRSQLAIAANLGSEIPNLKHLIDLTLRRTVLERIAAPGRAPNADVARIGDKLTAGGTLSFGDLHTLSAHVPGMKDMYCTSTAFYSGPGVAGQVPQLAVFSSSDDACRDMEISAAVCASVALPVVIKPRQHPMPHDLADAPTTRTRLMDGGISLHTPVCELIDPDTPPAENLILYFEKAVTTEERLGLAGTRRPSLAERAVKMFPSARYFVSKRKFLGHELIHGPQAHQAVEVKLKDLPGQADLSGSKWRMNIWMDQAAKDALQTHLHGRVLAHLAQRNGNKTFASLHHLLFSLDEEELRPLRAGGTPAIQAALGQVDGLRDSLGRFVATMKEWSDHRSRASLVQEVTRWLAEVDAALGDGEHCRDAVAQALAGDPAAPVQRMFDLLRGAAAPAGARSLHAVCLRKDEERAARRIAQRIRSEFIYPSLDKPLQVRRNDTALRQADEALSRAGSRAEINAVLGKLEADYAVLGSKALGSLSPVVSKLRTYYLGEAPATGVTLDPL